MHVLRSIYWCTLAYGFSKNTRNPVCRAETERLRSLGLHPGCPVVARICVIERGFCENGHDIHKLFPLHRTGHVPLGLREEYGILRCRAGAAHSMRAENDSCPVSCLSVHLDGQTIVSHVLRYLSCPPRWFLSDNAGLYGGLHSVFAAPKEHFPAPASRDRPFHHMQFPEKNVVKYLPLDKVTSFLFP